MTPSTDPDRPEGSGGRRQAGEPIDREKLRAAARKLGPEYIFYMLDDAIDLLPADRLARLAPPYLHLDQLRPDASPKKSLPDQVRAFHDAATGGEYYVEFEVNSRNCTEKSAGTLAFIADANRLLGGCARQASRAGAPEIRQAFELVFDVLTAFKRGDATIIFFGDEGGLEDLGIDWATVLRAYLECLSCSAEADEYARRAVEVVGEFRQPFREEYLSLALRLGSGAQRRELRRAMRPGR